MALAPEEEPDELPAGVVDVAGVEVVEDVDGVEVVEDVEGVEVVEDVEGVEAAAAVVAPKTPAKTPGVRATMAAATIAAEALRVVR